MNEWKTEKATASGNVAVMLLASSHCFNVALMLTYHSAISSISLFPPNICDVTVHANTWCEAGNSEVWGSTSLSAPCDITGDWLCFYHILFETEMDGLFSTRDVWAWPPINLRSMRYLRCWNSIKFESHLLPLLHNTAKRFLMESQSQSDLGGDTERHTRSRRAATGWGTGCRPPRGTAQTRAALCGKGHSWPCSSGSRWGPTG